MDRNDPLEDEAAAERLLEKLRRFIREELDDGERSALAVLVAPSVAQAAGPGDPNVAPSWAPVPLPEHLARLMRAARIRIVADA